MPFARMNRGRPEMEDKGHQVNHWQKIIRTPEDDVETANERPAWIRKYLDLADLLIRRVQRRMQRANFRDNRNHRKAA